MSVVSDLVEYQGVKMTAREKENLLSGMNAPALRRLSPGTKLYRVADAARSRSEAFQIAGEAGAWWTGQKAFGKMLQYCIQQDKEDRGLGYAAREACAVLFGWSSCDLLVEAYVKKNVQVFHGTGNPMSETRGGSTVTFGGWADIEQWFIPGLTEVVSTGGDNKRVQLNAHGNSVIEVYRTCSLRSAMDSATSYR
ncbi:MAG: hypothetical protein KDA85_03765 [Planctomycetaceae bacterium]|nr:hypothetical protein [Planctomycetaceae bacterium]